MSSILHTHCLVLVAGMAPAGPQPPTSHVPASASSAGSASTAASISQQALPSATNSILPKDVDLLLSLIFPLSVLFVQWRNVRIQQENQRIQQRSQRLQQESQMMQQESQKRQRSLEAFKAVSDFNESYAKLVDSIPQDFTIVLDKNKANFLLEKIPVEGASGNTGNEVIKYPFTSHESFFRRYWMLQMTQYQSKEEKFLPEETFTIWLRSNKVVYTQGSYWISAEAYRKGYKESRIFFQDPKSTGNKGVSEFIQFMDNHFKESEDISVLPESNDGVALDQEIIDKAIANQKVVDNYLEISSGDIGP